MRLSERRLVTELGSRAAASESVSLRGGSLLLETALLCAATVVCGLTNLLARALRRTLTARLVAALLSVVGARHLSASATQRRTNLVNL